MAVPADLVVDLQEFNKDIRVTEKCRKRKQNPESWKKNVDKRIKYSGSGKKPVVACKHARKTRLCQADEKLTNEDLEGIS